MELAVSKATHPVDTSPPPGKEADRRKRREDFEAVVGWFTDLDNVGPHMATRCSKDLNLPLSYVNYARRTKEFFERTNEMLREGLQQGVPRVLSALEQFAVKEAKNQRDRETYLRVAGVLDHKGDQSQELKQLNITQNIVQIVARDAREMVKLRDATLKMLPQDAVEVQEVSPECRESDKRDKANDALTLSASMPPSPDNPNP